MTKRYSPRPLVLVVIVLVLAAGFGASRYAGWRLRDERYRIAPSQVQPCPERSEAVCRAIPKYNANSSGGYTGFPFRDGRYYCVDDEHCMKVSRSYVRGISPSSVNGLVWSAGFALTLIGGYMLVRRLQKT